MLLDAEEAAEKAADEALENEALENEAHRSKSNSRKKIFCEDDKDGNDEAVVTIHTWNKRK